MTEKNIILYKKFAQSNPLFLYGITALIGCIILNIGIFKNYAFADSYEFLWLADVSHTFQHEFIRGGRPIYGLLNQLTFGKLCDKISDLKWIRFFSLIGCVIFSVQIFSFLLKLKLKPLESALFSFLIFSIPSFSIFIGWSSTYQIPWSLNFSFLAGLLLCKTLEDKKFNILKYITAIILVIISLCLYQSAGTAFLIPFVFVAVVSNHFEKQKLIQLIVFLSISFILYFVFFKLTLYWHNVEPLNRSKLNIFKLPFRFLLFYVRDMKTILQGSGIIIWSNLFLIIGLITFAGFFLLQKSTNKNYFMLFFLLFVIPLSYLPNLLSANVWICSRTVAPAAIIILFYQFYFLKQLSKKKKIIKSLSFILTLALLTAGFINLNTYISGIQNKEFKALKSAFEKIPLDNSKNIIFIIPNRDFLIENGYFANYYSDEFVQVSSSRTWVPSPLLNQVQKEKNKQNNSKKEYAPNYSIQVYTIDELNINTSNSIVIDINEILKNEFSK